VLQIVFFQYSDLAVEVACQGQEKKDSSLVQGNTVDEDLLDFAYDARHMHHHLPSVIYLKGRSRWLSS
jgi:hypothetical protein